MLQNWDEGLNLNPEHTDVWGQQVIRAAPKNGVLVDRSDPHKDNCAIVY